MQYALFPFPSLKGAGGPDICEQLRIRKSECQPRPPRLDNLKLLESVIEVLRDLPWDIRVDYCHEQDGNLRLAVVAVDLGRNMEKDDKVNAGFCLANSEQDQFDTVACERVYRVACENGAIIECEKHQSVVLPASEKRRRWKKEIPKVIARSFDSDGVDIDLGRFHATTTRILTAPYELLCNLVSQRIISEEEQSQIQNEFTESADFTIYGLVNAVTRIARRLRDFDDWMRAFQMECLGGHILRGDYQPPVSDPVYAN